MREILEPAWKLFIIALVAGLVLSLTNAATKDAIAAQQRVESEAAKFVLTSAETFELVNEGEGGMDNVYRGFNSSGDMVGLVGTITTNGYGGKIEVTVGLAASGEVTGISVGGPNFNETVNLGAKVKEPAFTDQFAGKEPPFTLKEDIIPTTSATISSTACLLYTSRCV